MNANSFRSRIVTTLPLGARKENARWLLVDTHLHLLALGLRFHGGRGWTGACICLGSLGAGTVSVGGHVLFRVDAIQGLAP